MTDLITINYNNERPTVLARDLHNGLEIQTPYHKWFPRMCEYGFTEGVDFATVDKNVLRADGSEMPQTQHDHQITIEMAKEICMIQRSEKGKQYRQYFLQLEKDWNSPEKVMARALQIADKRIHTLEAKVEQDRPKVLFADAVDASQTSILIGDLAKLIKQNGVDIGQKRLFAWMRENGFLMKSGSSTNMPTQKAMDMKLFEVKERTFSNPDGSIRTTRTTKVTGKGQQYFINRFLGEKESA